MSGNLAPAFELLINGSTPLPSGYMALISGVTVDSTVDGADELVITAQAYNPTGKPGSRWAFVGESILAPGNLVIVRAGYVDGTGLVALQRFRLIGEDTSYSAGGAPTVKIRGYSAEARLGETTTARAWEGPIADSDIVAELAEEHGLTVDGDSLVATDTRDAGRIKPKGDSDLVFLRRLAVANGYGPPLVRYSEDLDADVLFFRPQTTGESLTFTHDVVEAEADLASGNLLTFQANLDLHGVPTSVEVTGWDPVTQEPVVVIMAIADAGQDPMILTGDAASRAGYELKSGPEFQVRALSDSDDPRTEIVEAVAVPTVTTVEEATAWATRWVKLRAMAFLTGSATILGNPKVWAGQVHTFQGLAPTHTGLWEVLGARHTFTASGYAVSMDLARVLEDSAEPEEA